MSKSKLCKIILYILIYNTFSKSIKMFVTLLWASLATQTVKNLPAMLGRFPKKGNGNSTPVFLPGESHGQRNLRDYSPLGRSIRHD